MEDFHMQTARRLMRYAAIGTQSAENADRYPTTACQHDLAKVLYEELLALGLRAEYDRQACLVYGWIDATVPDAEPIGLIAHMDTSPEVPGMEVKPWLLERYDGGDILLNPALDIRMRAADYPNLAQYVGQALVLTDGTTLLGGDDKAAVAALMTLAEHYARHPDLPHPKICLAFTPDEEVGGLARDLDLERFGARFAYTIDGDHLGWYQDQTFYAAQARFVITGRSVHPGTAKDIMINAAELAAEVVGMLPMDQRPQTTQGTQGFYHVLSLAGDCEHAELSLIVRDFDPDAFAARQDHLRACAAALNARHPGCAALEIRQQYRNMGEVLSRWPFLTRQLDAAIRAAGLQPVCEPFRGGTDGAALSFRGLPCPNLSAGYENAHGRFEFVPVPSMAKNVEILLYLCAHFKEE